MMKRVIPRNKITREFSQKRTRLFIRIERRPYSKSPGVGDFLK